MKRILLVALALATTLSASVASAQYLAHDGTAENNVGMAGVTINWGTSFAVNPNQTTLTSIDVGFGVDLLGDFTLTGDLVAWQIFGDDDDSPVNGMTALTSVGLHNVINEDFEVNGVFDNISTGNVDISGFEFLFIGLSYFDLEGGTFIAAQDTDSGSLGTSWVGIGLDSLNPADYSGIAGTVDSFDIPGNFIITGNTIPEPSTFSVACLCGIFAAFRRRQLTEVSRL